MLVLLGTPLTVTIHRYVPPSSGNTSAMTSLHSPTENEMV